MKGIALLIFVAIALSGCKKNYTCECRNSNATYTSGGIYATEKQANKKCRALSSGDTSCYAK